jgi:hypothetical protein
MAIEAEHQQTTTLLETHRNILLGAFAVLYSTFLAATAGNARMWTDSFKLPLTTTRPPSIRVQER